MVATFEKDALIPVSTFILNAKYPLIRRGHSFMVAAFEKDVEEVSQKKIPISC